MYDFTDVTKNSGSLPDNFLTRATKYLAARGITDPDLIDHLSLKIMPSGSLFTSLYRKGQYGMVSYQNDNRVAVVIPHFNLLGEPIEWWSARLIDAGEASGFAKLVKDNRPKMLAPVNEPPHAYLCPLNDWTKLKEGQKIYIHESAIKAINGALLGYHSVGLNGVAGFASRRHNLSLVDELKDIPWKNLKLQPVIVFDNDYVGNWNVSSAIRILSQKLNTVVGSKPAVHIPLPNPSEERFGEHWGFDDAVSVLGRDWAVEYLEGDGVPVEGDPLQIEMSQLNTEVVVIEELGRIVHQEKGYIWSRANFADLVYANNVVWQEKDDGTVRKIQVAKEWLSWEQRAAVPTIDYNPGGPRIVPGECFNTWNGMGVDPYPGEVTPVIQLLDNNLQPEEHSWFLDWLAYPLQYLGAKLTTATVLVGPPGVGKSLLGSFMCRIYGDINSVSIGRESFESNFSSIYGTRQLVVLDEMHDEYNGQGGGKKVLNRLKKIITDPSIVVNTKGVPEYIVKNHVNLLITTNYVDALRLDESDRRFAVLRFAPKKDYTQDQEYWEQMAAWSNEGGLESFYHFLLERNLEAFNPHGWAPMTEEKKIMVETTRSGLEAWVQELLNSPDTILPAPVKGRALFTTKELGLFYSDGQPQSSQALSQKLGKELSKAGIIKAGAAPQHLIKIHGVQARYFVIQRRDEDWTDGKKCRAHLTEYFSQLPESKF